MANTYSQLYVHAVFAVKGRQNLIHEDIRDELEKYMCGIIKNNKSKPIAIYCNPDHTHILIGLHPEISVSEITGDIKSGSSKWINENKKIKGKFNWQMGFGAFTYSRSQIGRVSDYIFNQKEHHKKRSFKNEYLDLLRKFEVDFNEVYLFDWIE